MKKVIKTLLLVFWLIVIYSLSGQSGSVSSGLSNKLLTIIGETINSIYTIDVPKFVLDYSILIRKLAHVTEYFILFILSYECFKEYNVNNVVVICLLFCFICASVDEFHQLFVDGRGGQFKDVLIDSTGAFISFVFWHLLIKK